MNGSSNPVPAELPYHPESCCLDYPLNRPSNVVRRAVGAYLPKTFPESLNGHIKQLLGNWTATTARHSHSNISDEAFPTDSDVQLHEITKL
jgi:hypothetical protein